MFEPPMLKLMRMPEARAVFGHYAGASHLYEAVSAEVDLFTTNQKENIDLLLTGSPLFFGQAGSGKSGAAGRSLEQVLKAPENVQVLISDMTGEHEGIVDLYPGKFERVDMNGDPRADAERFFNTDKSFYYDLSAYDRAVYLKYYDVFLSHFYHLKAEVNEDFRRAHVFVFEEAQNLVPEFAPATDKDTLGALMRVREHIKKFGLQGRKFGFSVWLITQRPSMCAKDIISQSRTRFLFRVFERNDVEVYAAMLPGAIKRELIKNLNSMKPGECYFVDGKRVIMRRFKMKKSKDRGRTPGYAATAGWKATAEVNNL